MIQLVTEFNINVFNIYENINWYSITTNKTTIPKCLSEMLATVALHTTFSDILFTFFFFLLPTIATKQS